MCAPRCVAFAVSEERIQFLSAHFCKYMQSSSELLPYSALPQAIYELMILMMRHSNIPIFEEAHCMPSKLADLVVENSLMDQVLAVPCLCRCPCFLDVCVDLERQATG